MKSNWEITQERQMTDFKKGNKVFSDYCNEGSLIVGALLNKLIPNKECLDVGCGIAPLPKYMEYAQSVIFTGIDPFDAKGSQFKFIRGKAESMPFKDNTFDAVLFATTLDHLEDPEKSLNESFRVLKDGGYLLIWGSFRLKNDVKYQQWLKTKSVDIFNHPWAFTLSSINSLLKNGFYLIEKIDILNNQKVLIYKKDIRCMDKELMKNIETEANYVKTVKLGYYPNILHPKTFNEHLLHIKFFCKDELLVTTTDKVAVNNYVKEKGLENILIPNYYITDNPESIPFDTLPDEYIVKPNQLSGSIMHVKNNNINRGKIISTCREWLKETHYGKNRFLWFTAKIKPMIIVQKVISKNPCDYKFNMINGRCAFIGVHSSDMIGGHPRRAIFYDTDWSLLPFRYQQELCKPVARPPYLVKMIRISEKLSKPFEYVRVDLYNIDGKIYFGELSHIPNSGSGRFIPECYDHIFGKLFDK